MRKYVKITLIVLIVLLVGALNTYAATETTAVTAIVDKTDVKVGDIVTINLSANCENGIEGIDATLEYDETKLELQSLNIDTKFSNMSGTDDSTGKYKLTVISNSTETLTSENFATLKFKVLDAAQVDEELTIKLSEIELGDSNDEWTKIDNKEVTLKIVEATPAEGENNPGDNNNAGEDNNGTEGNNNLGNNDNTPEEDGNNQSTNTGKEDNTQADKVIDYAGLEDYTFIIVVAISIISIIAYKKYNQYKNI